VATALAINARFLIYSAALSRTWRDQPRWFRWLAPYFLVDQLFALVGAQEGEGRDPAWMRGYYLAGAAVLWVTWLLVVAIGAAAGPVLPARQALAFASPALLTALVVPALRGRPALAAGLVASAVAVAARPWLGSGALLAAAAAGMLAGRIAERGGR
jgi:predicted branched-subunit amino acid permease